MSPATRDLHEEAIELFARGERVEAIGLLRRAVTESLRPDLVNDLAAMLAAAGERGEAAELLRGLLRLAPGFAPAEENLAFIEPATSEGADGATGMAEARDVFLQLVTEATAIRLTDNLDHLFHPFGHPLPDPAAVGGRLAAQLAVLEQCGVLWQRLGDDVSRELLLRFLAYRALGPEHVRLQLEPEPYRRAVVGLAVKALRQAGVHGVPGAPFEWQLHLFDLAELGVPVRIIGQPLGLASTYVFSQYAYRDELAAAGPRPGDVALDAGGCWGETALWLAHAVGDHGRVHTFEPSPANREVLERNLELNPALAQRIRVHPAPLAARAGETVWIDDGIWPGAVMSNERRAEEIPAVSVQTDTIDALVERGEIDRVDFLKIDVEGADLAVLEGASRTIRSQRPRLAIAAYHRHDDLVSIPRLIESLGVDYCWYLQCSTMTDVDTVAFAVPA